MPEPFEDEPNSDPKVPPAVCVVPELDGVNKPPELPLPKLAEEADVVAGRVPNENELKAVAEVAFVEEVEAVLGGGLLVLLDPNRLMAGAGVGVEEGGEVEAACGVLLAEGLNRLLVPAVVELDEVDAVVADWELGTPPVEPNRPLACRTVELVEGLELSGSRVGIVGIQPH